jgi:predicted transposase/invertase (TIGR01784 family)
MKGRQFIVEMQMYWTESFKNRVVFNASKAYVKQLDSAKEYKLLQPVYALSLVNENFEPEMEDFYHHYKIVNTTNPDKAIEGLEFVFVELRKFKAKNISERKLQYLWLKFLTEIEDGTENIPKELLEEELIKEAIAYLESNSYSKAQLEHYDRYWDSILSERSAYLDAEERGRIDGMEKGMEKGMVEGMEKGIKENKIDVAKAALKEALPIATIMNITGLTKGEIESLL